MEYGATMKQINCIRYFWSLLQADSGHICFGLECPFNTRKTDRLIEPILRFNSEIFFLVKLTEACPFMTFPR